MPAGALAWSSTPPARLLSAIVFITAAITKFTEGAWVAVLAVGLFVLLRLRIRRHYDSVGEAIALHPHAIEVPPATLRAEAAPEPTVPAERRRARRGAGPRAKRAPTRSAT